jgi:hypothetical protein
VYFRKLQTEKAKKETKIQKHSGELKYSFAESRSRQKNQNPLRKAALRVHSFFYAITILALEGLFSA